MEKPDGTIRIYGDDREKESFKKFLKQVYLTNSDKLEQLFDLMPHEVLDVIDAISQSRLN